MKRPAFSLAFVKLQNRMLVFKVVQKHQGNGLRTTKGRDSKGIPTVQNQNAKELYLQIMGEPEKNVSLYSTLRKSQESSPIIRGNWGIPNHKPIFMQYKLLLCKKPVETKAENLVSNVHRILVCLGTWQKQKQTFSEETSFQPQHSRLPTYEFPRTIISHSHTHIHTRMHEVTHTMSDSRKTDSIIRLSKSLCTRIIKK